LTWTDNSAVEDGYWVLRYDCYSYDYYDCGYFMIAELPADATSFNDTGLASETWYSYYVVAFKDGGTSDYSNEFSATTGAAPLGVGRASVLVSPNANDQGTAETIQEGIDMVGEGGTVLVLPGTYAEAIVIGKGLTLESVGGESGPVVVEPPGAPTTAVAITTPAPVVIRGLTVHVTGVNGIRGAGVVDVTVERVSVTAVSPPLGVDRLISVGNDPNPTGARARLTVRESFMDGTIACATWPAACTFDAAATFPQIFGIIAGGDVDALLERNVIRRAGGACIFVVVRNDLGGE